MGHSVNWKWRLHNLLIILILFCIFLFSWKHSRVAKFPVRPPVGNPCFTTLQTLKISNISYSSSFSSLQAKCYKKDFRKMFHQIWSSNYNRWYVHGWIRYFKRRFGRRFWCKNTFRSHQHETRVRIFHNYCYHFNITGTYSIVYPKCSFKIYTKMNFNLNSCVAVDKNIK